MESCDCLLTILDRTHLCLLAVDCESRITALNKCAVDFIGHPQADLIGKRLSDVFAGVPELQYVEQCLGGGPETLGAEVPFVWAGSSKFLQVSIYKQWHKGQIKGALLTWLDISNIHLNRNQVSRSMQQDAISRITVGLAHELRNPLVIIRGYLQVLLHKHLMLPSYKRVFRILIGQVDKTDALIQSFISLYKPMKLSTKLVNLGAMAEGVAALLQPVASLSDIKISVISTSAHLWCMGDKERLEQVLINIIKNSLEAISSGDSGQITISFQELSGYNCITVADNGCGIPAKSMHRLGTPFFTTKPSGTGNGLATVYSMINQHGGYVEVESRVDAGTQVHVYLPQASA